MSPDPSGLAYADPTNPQSLNLYSYALNNPLKFTDPTGMYCDYSDHNDPSSGFDSSQFDYNSNSGECGQNGGQWVDDAYTQNGADIGDRPQYAVSGVANSGQGMPLTGTFGPQDIGNLTLTQFVNSMQTVGVTLSPIDDLLYTLSGKKIGHPGTNMRDSSDQCSLHLNVNPGTGVNGVPVSGSFHFDEYNPYTFEPPPSLARRCERRWSATDTKSWGAFNPRCHSRHEERKRPGLDGQSKLLYESTSLDPCGRVLKVGVQGA
jgi:hypothetical protein